MLRIFRAFGAAALSVGLIAPAFAQAPNDGLPEDPAKAIIMSACTACHDVGLITQKPRTPDEWDTLIGKMVDRGAALTTEERAQVYAYLVKNLGMKPDVSPLPTPAPVPAPGA